MADGQTRGVGSAQPCGCDPGLEWVCDRHRAEGVSYDSMRSQYAIEGSALGSSAPIQTFASGATRNTDDNKFDYEGFLHPVVMYEFGRYMHEHRKQRDGSVRDSDNWQKGIPLAKYMKSLLRHTFDLWRLHRGYPVIDPDTGKPATTTDLLCAIMFNAMGYLKEFVAPSPVNQCKNREAQ